MEVDRVGVHQSHCCLIHGCKYGAYNGPCPVEQQEVVQDYPCEECQWVQEELPHWLSAATVEQLQAEIERRKC